MQKDKLKKYIEKLDTGSLVKLKTRKQLRDSKNCKYWYDIGYVHNLLEYGGKVVKVFRVKDFCFCFFDNDGWTVWELPYELIEKVVKY